MQSIFSNRILATAALSAVVASGLTACQRGPEPDAYGNLETVEVIVSADCNGKLLEFNLEEGSRVHRGEIVGWVDTTQLVLQRNQLQGEIAVLRAQLPEREKQLDVVRERLAKVQRELARYTALAEKDASTRQQVDNLHYDAEILQKQLDAERSTLDIQTRTLLARMEPLRQQILQVQDRIDNAYVVNPIAGRVLAKYAERYELATIGKPLYKVANLDTMILRAYIEEPQLAAIRLGQEVTVQVDSVYVKNGFRMPGRIGWIADQAEFTPKVIQTRSERANLVYALKIYVPNRDGVLKIGMPAEVYFDPHTLAAQE
ncbi:HlyD family efflux transporter periplasmic adaptor subunit [uncultured Rikenella sp.]|uniref:HlyD family secretion protein n=1 Tax=uncultured Rikenella sp. TaxID=368003 RepID=UPI002627C03B|nr:HlyD family efflux transporter periplasmic adaptor subunit [uncultured Rikenella sp.]